MARSIWKGSIAFGLVNIPVELHTGVRDSRPRFRMLHADDKSPVKFERVCVKEGKPVAWEELVKGYEYERGRFVVLSKEDFRSAAVEKTRTVDIRSFVKPSEIDDRFFETAYYLVPAKGAERAYALLREAIRQTERVGIATIVMRDAQHLAAVEVIKDALVLTLMRYADELVDVSTYTFPPARDIRKPELAMAVTLVENLADEWDPSKYTDEYRENLMKIIKAKLKGKDVRLTAHVEPRDAGVVDLMERLRESLEGCEPPEKAPKAREDCTSEENGRDNEAPSRSVGPGPFGPDVRWVGAPLERRPHVGAAHAGQHR
jgi:DNA end-binding protein Ku